MTHRFSGWYKAMVVKSEVLGEGFQVGKLAAFSKVGDSIVVTNWERFVTLTTEQAQVALKAWRDRKHKSPKYPEGPLVPVSDGPSIERKYARVR